MFDRILLTALLMMATLSALSLPARAGNFDVSPVRVHLEPKSPTSAVTLRNTSTQPMVIHVELMKWTGENQKTPSQDLLVNPPIFTIAPQASQVIRLGMGELSSPGEELAYRLYLQEVPSRSPQEGTVLQTALRVGIPIFIPPAVSRREIQWKTRRDRRGIVHVRAINQGNVHVQLLDVDLSVPGKWRLQREIREYLLPGQSKEWSLGRTDRWKSRQLKLAARTDGDELNAMLEADAR